VVKNLKILFNLIKFVLLEEDMKPVSIVLYFVVSGFRIVRSLFSALGVYSLEEAHVLNRYHRYLASKSYTNNGSFKKHRYFVHCSLCLAIYQMALVFILNNIKIKMVTWKLYCRQSYLTVLHSLGCQHRLI
jgi:hypothetical protein